MKYLISADIEGIGQTSHWHETFKDHADYRPMAKAMTQEIASVCEGILKEEPKAEIWVKDAHGTGRNLIPELLPKKTIILSGWQGSPLSMVEGLDESFQGIFFIGYHQGANLQGNPLSHTMDMDLIAMTINGKAITEYQLFRWAGAYYRVPTLMLSGDYALCAQARLEDEDLVTVVTKEGLGGAVASYHPLDIQERLFLGAREAVKHKGKKIDSLAEAFKLEIEYPTEARAYKLSFYPGAKWVKPRKVTLEVEDYFDLLRAVSFLA